MSNRVTAAYQFFRQQGLATGLFRVKHALAKRTGKLKQRFPAVEWSDVPLAAWVRSGVPTEPAAYRRYRETVPAQFFFKPGSLPKIEPAWLKSAVVQAKEFCRGEFTYFSRLKASLGDPPDWLLNPFTGKRFDDRHWCDRDDLDPRYGDIKFVWEPSRFSWAYTLVRAYAATGDEKYPAQFWKLFESWCQANPPQLGPNWQCGQECTLRIMACIFSLYGLWKSPHTTDQRLADMAAVIALTGDRIAGNIDFARSLRNNHTVSEAAGLYTIGLLFPEFKQATRWREQGKRILETECIEQFYADGSHVQHSFNYQRFVFDVFSWVICLAQANGEAFRPELLKALQRSVDFLWHVQDETSGRVPNYGSNDGALVLPLTGCDYLDYRPALQTLHRILTHEPLYDSGPWDEEVDWLLGAPENHRLQSGGTLHQLKTGATRLSLHACAGGYYTLRGRESWAMIRCHTYRHRPVQADMLHLDLWWKGENVLRDAGTFSYNCEDPWLRYFPGTAAHNTVVVDESDQMERGSRFMWSHWLTSAVDCHQRFSDTVDIEYWQGSHYGYYRTRSLVIHVRAVARINESHWLIVDDILGDTPPRSLRIAWHCCDVPFRQNGPTLHLQTHSGALKLEIVTHTTTTEVFRAANAMSPNGWESLYYGQRSSRPCFASVVRPRPLTRIVSLLRLTSANDEAARLDRDIVRWREVAPDAEYSADLSDLDDWPQRRLVKSIAVNGQRCTIDPKVGRVGLFWPMS